MHHGKSIAILFALTGAALSAAPAAAVSIHPAAEGAFLLDPPQLLPATMATDSPPMEYASLSELRDFDAGRGDSRWGRDGRWLDGDGDHGQGDGDGDHRGDWNYRGDGDHDRHPRGDWNRGGGWDGDGHHHHRGGEGDGGGTPQTLPLPNALPLLLGGLASLLTLGRRRRE